MAEWYGMMALSDRAQGPESEIVDRIPERDHASSLGGVGVWLKAAREHRGWSARSLSRKAGLSESYVTKLEAGQIVPSLSAFARLAVQLELNINEIYLCVLAASRENLNEV